MSKCIACTQLISVTEKLNCSQCSSCFHYSCVNISKENYNKLSQRSKSNWKCPACKIPKRGGDETPVKNDYDDDQRDSSQNVTVSLLDERLKHLETSISASLTGTMAELLKKQLQSEFDSLRTTMQEIPSLIESVKFLSQQFDDMHKEIAELRKTSSELRAENQFLRESVSELNTRISQIEQHSRENNVELQCLPEFSNENLPNTIQQLIKVVSCPLVEKDIVSATRVAKTNNQSARPRSVIIKTISPMAKDTLLASCITYNKTHLSDKLSSAHLGLGGAKQLIYLSEHLSPGNRALHAQARIFKRENNYKYVWVRNGRVLLRRDDSSKATWVRDTDVLRKLLVSS